MHTVEILGHCLDLARRMGYEIRQEWLAGNGGGGCIFRGRKILFLDLALGPPNSSIKSSTPSAAIPKPPSFLCRKWYMICSGCGRARKAIRKQP